PRSCRNFARAEASVLISSRACSAFTAASDLSMSSTLIQSCMPVLNDVVYHPERSFLQRTPKRTNETPVAEGSDASGIPKPLIDLIRTQSLGSCISNNAAIKHLACLTLRSLTTCC